MSLPHAMTAIAITEPGGPDVLQPVSVPVPVPGHGQILIKVAFLASTAPMRCNGPGPMPHLPVRRPCRGWNVLAMWQP